MSALYRQADFAIVCGGAMTLAEVAAVGLPSLIVPLSTAADNHQAYNARAFATRTGTSWVSESDWDTGEVVDKICHFLTNPKAREQLSASTRNGNPANAAQAIAADSLALMTSAATEAANTVKAGTGP
jgi:UDP-N-acetylglucosamine--N-acetylmuramyl-(pentapeptide) pyrophosphoryl-undecaprenol N-acetylglucosamine transferase